jgi:hypothetical protein
MHIPKEFKISNKRYTVDFVRHTQPKGTMGEVVYALRKISIATHSGLNNRSFKQEEMDDTFWHEVTHAILKDMGHNLWNNERFVTRFANRLSEVVNTAKL